MPTYAVTFKLVDAYGREGLKTFETVEIDQPTAVIAAAAMATDLAALTEMELLQHTVKEVVLDTDTADAGANKDEGATFSVRKADNQKGIVKVPAPVQAVRNTDGTIDISHVAVTDFMGNFITGNWVISDGETVISTLGGTLDV